MQSQKNVRNTHFQLGDDISDPSKIKDPLTLLEQLNEKYKRQKAMYRETRDYYFRLNLFVFYLPLLIVQGMTSVLTHSAMTTGKDDDNSMKLLVAVLNGVLSVWTAAQMKLGWNQKYQSANSTLIKYRDMSGRVAMLCLILDCQKTKSAVGVVEFINNCYENEKNIMQSEIAIPTFIARKYRKAAISKVMKLRQLVIL
ncbi:uncharacterized protein LOC134853502 [Symsagittifera roscoffensis]|uniref:uncharacterized protein LOC134853502 n=1 Tax=Symsagittifera roscoffensis TaxID=84072 RepID=UPI00307BAAF3